LLLPFSYQPTILVKFITKKFEIYKKGCQVLWGIAVRLRDDNVVFRENVSIAQGFSPGLFELGSHQTPGRLRPSTLMMALWTKGVNALPS